MDITSTLKVFDLTPTDGQMILVGMATFFVFWRLFDAVVFKPFLNLYIAREAVTTGASESSKAILDEALLIAKRVDEQIHEARVLAMTEKYKVISEAKKEASSVISSAEDDVQELVRKARWDRQANISSFREDVLKESSSLAKAIAERLKNPSSYISSILFLIFVFAPSFYASASEGAHHGTGSPADLIPYWINFSIFVVLMTLILKKPVSKGWGARVDSISQLVNKGLLEREKAEAELSTSKRKELSVSTESESIIKQIKKETEAEAQEIILDAKERAKRILAQGKDMVVAEQKSFEVELRRELAGEVVKKATEILKNDLNSSNDMPLRNVAVENIGQLLN